MSTGMTGEALLAAMQVRKEFGVLIAVNDVDFIVPRGAVAGLSNGQTKPAGDGSLHCLRLEASLRERALDPPDRARHACRDGRLRSWIGSRLRREDRLGNAVGRPAHAAGDRGLSRDGG